MFIITSEKHGFRRCGVSHPAEPTEYADGTFTPEQIEELQTEPMLTVVEQPEKDGKGKGKKTDFTPEQVEELRAEPMLTVVEQPEKDGKGKGKKTDLKPGEE